MPASDQLVRALDAVSDSFALYGPDDRLVFCNERYRRNYHPIMVVPGILFEELMRRQVDIGLIPAAVGREKEWLAERMQRFRAPGEAFDILRRDGRWIQARDERLPDGSTFVTGLDITERKEAEREVGQYREHLEDLVEARTRELESVRQDLLKSERLAGFGELAATVSHELRNPLGTLKATTTTLRVDVPAGDERVARALDRLDRNIDRCTRIVQELVDFAQVRELVRVRADLAECVARVLADFDAPQGVEIELRPGHSVRVEADERRITQCLGHILNNACQSVHESGVTGRIVVATGADDGRAWIAVSDNGPGVALELRERIFEPLYSTRSHGVGLGLTLVRQTMEQHGGGVEVGEANGGGARFELWLPVQMPDC